MDNYLLSITDRAGNVTSISIVIENPYNVAPDNEYKKFSYFIDDDNNFINLSSYNGKDTDLTDVIVYDNYIFNGKKYRTKLSNGNNFFSYGNKNYIEKITFGNNIETSDITSMENMFALCTSLKTIDFGKSFNTSNVTTMMGTFQGCTSLVNINLSNFDTSKVKNFSLTFYNCSSLTKLDLSSFSNENMYFGRTFEGCTNLAVIYVSSEKWINTEKWLLALENADIFENCGISEVTYV